MWISKIQAGAGSERRMLPSSKDMTGSAIAGIVGPLLFTALVIVQGLLHPDYSHRAHVISALAAWPTGWIQRINFALLGILMCAYGIGLHRGVRPGRGGPAGLVLLLVSGLGLVIAGAFSIRRTAAGFTEPPGHVVGAVMSFLGAGTALVAMSLRMRDDPDWRAAAGFAMAAGLAIVALFPVLPALALPPDAPLHAWAGAVQRVIVAVWFTCTIALAVRLLRLARRDPAHR
jgi:hypothetical membrane protein